MSNPPSIDSYLHDIFGVLEELVKELRRLNDNIEYEQNHRSGS